jgi:hypothetical protein
MTDPERGIRRLHEVIEAWFRGETDDLAPFADALAPEFEQVSPDGVVSDRDAVVTGLREAHADDPDLTIEIRDAAHRITVGDGHLIRYEEHQRTDDERTGRVSTALL